MKSYVIFLGIGLSFLLLPAQLAWSNETDSTQEFHGTDPGDPSWQLIGSYLRTQVTATTAWPYRAMGMLGSGCTGTLVGPKHVITAAHCVWNDEDETWYDDLEFRPGRNGFKSPYGKIDWAHVVAPSPYVNRQESAYDFAMVILKEPIGNRVGWMSFGYNDWMWNIKINMNGYPEDKKYGTLWHVFCPVTWMFSQHMYYRCDTMGGMSGSAVYRYFEEKRVIYGIHTTGGPSEYLNSGVRINKSVFERIKGWIAKYQ